MRKEEVLHIVSKDFTILHIAKRRKVNWIGHILHGNCLLKHITEGRMEVIVRRGRRRKELMDDFKETRGYWKLKKNGKH